MYLNAAYTCKPIDLKINTSINIIYACVVFTMPHHYLYGPYTCATPNGLKKHKGNIIYYLHTFHRVDICHSLQSVPMYHISAILISFHYLYYTPCLLPKYLFFVDFRGHKGRENDLGGWGEGWRSLLIHTDIYGNAQDAKKMWRIVIDSVHRTPTLLWSASFLLVYVICKAARSLLSSRYSAIFCFSSAFFSLSRSFRHSSSRSLR